MDKMKLIEQCNSKRTCRRSVSGDTINVHVRVVEGDKERIQQFQGVVIARRGAD